MRRAAALLVCVWSMAWSTACPCPAWLRGGAADVLIPPADEERLGDQLRAQVLQQETVLDDEEVQAYISGIGERLTRLAGPRIPEGITTHFTVLEGDMVNAFAGPGGEIFVFTGLIRAAGNEAELVGVLAHELGHVAERHVAQGLVTQLGVETVLALALGQDPGLLSQIAGTVAAQGYLLRYSRAAEREADTFAMELMIESEWDPRGLIAFFDTLSEMYGRDPSAIETFFSSHPPPGDRAEYLTRMWEEAGSPTGQTNEQRLAGIQRRLPERAADAPGERPPRG